MTNQQITDEQYKEYLRAAVKLSDSNEIEDSTLYLKTLAGDASTRRYYRLVSKNPQHASMVMMRMEAFDAAENNFLLVREVMDSCHISVPKCLALQAKKGAILLNDLGERTMLHELEASMSDAVQLDLFRKAIELLVDIHENVQAGINKSIDAFQLEFDQAKLMWEVDYTFEHLFGNYLKRNIPATEQLILRDAFVDICARLSAEPKVFTHRDYHSRNLMCTDGKDLHCIDFQDARMGLRQYDLASILRDSYYQLTDERVYELVDYYISLVEKRNKSKIDHTHFVQLFDLMSIQRNFKAIGSFTSFYARRGDATYLRFIGNTFENIRRNLYKFPEYKDMQRLLFSWYYF